MTTLLLDNLLFSGKDRTLSGLTGIRSVWGLIVATFLQQVLVSFAVDCYFDQFSQVVRKLWVGLLVVFSFTCVCLLNWLDIKIRASDPSLETSKRWCLYSYYFELPGPLLVVVDLEGVVDEKVWVTVPSLLAKFRGEWHLKLPLEGEIWTTRVHFSQTRFFK